MLKGKTVILGVSGSIAAYKIADLASKLSKLHCEVHVIMTKNATNFINPITFETLTNNKCLVDTFDRNFQYNVEHVALSKKADVILVAPATANVIAKMAHGLADDMLTTTILACTCPRLVSPAMNTQMLHNPITQDNLDILKHYGFEIIEPAAGMLACKDIGEGKLPDTDVLLDYILKTIAFEKDMEGLNVLVTAGPTQESLDPVRYITNHSTGKMGYALARIAKAKGAAVTLVTGKTSLSKPVGIDVVEIVSARDMFREVTERYFDCDVVINNGSFLCTCFSLCIGLEGSPKDLPCRNGNRLCTDEANESSLGVHNDDTLVGGGRNNVDSAVGVNCHCNRLVCRVVGEQLAFGRVDDLLEVMRLFVKLYQTVVTGVAYPNGIVGNEHTLGGYQSVVVARTVKEGGDVALELEIAVENRDLVVIGVGNVNVAVLIRNHILRILQVHRKSHIRIDQCLLCRISIGRIQSKTVDGVGVGLVCRGSTNAYRHCGYDHCEAQYQQYYRCKLFHIVLL